MNKLIWIACVVFPLLVDATAFHQQCEISCPDDSSQGGEVLSTKPCNCLILEEKLSKTEVELAKTEDELAKTKNELSDLKEKPRDCYDVIYYNPDAASGVYTIFPSNYRPGGIAVWCDMETDGGGWIVFQNRRDGSVDFYRDWKDYVVGFGNLTNEFWLGLEFIHQLSRYGTNDLRIDMTDFEKQEAYAVYSSFSIGDGDEGYTLKFTDYFGDAGDSLRDGLNHRFSTKDHDQDHTSSTNCAEKFVAAWWFDNCHEASLNGEYLGGPIEVYAHGMIWSAWKGWYYSLKTTSMKMRPHYANYA